MRSQPIGSRSVTSGFSRAHCATWASIAARGRAESTLVLGGGTREGGYYVEPTIFDDVSPGARIAQEEIFGPVLAIVRPRDFDHALDIANDTQFGLAGAVFTTDPDRIERRVSASTSATCTSTGDARERSRAPIRSEAST